MNPQSTASDPYPPPSVDNEVRAVSQKRPAAQGCPATSPKVQVSTPQRIARRKSVIQDMAPNPSSQILTMITTMLPKLPPQNQRLLIWGMILVGAVAFGGWFAICYQDPKAAADVLKVWLSH